jgi:hypothetical protein
VRKDTKPEGADQARKQEKVENRREKFKKWREWESGGATGEQLGLLKGPELFLYLAGDDSLDQKIAEVPQLNSEASPSKATSSEGTGSETAGSEITGLEGTSLETIGLDHMVTHSGKAIEIRVQE